MNNKLNLNDITLQIKQYIRQIKEKQSGEFNIAVSDINDKKSVCYYNDLRSNINKLDAGNKFSLQNIASEEISDITDSEYVSAAYEHLSLLEEKHRVIIDFMHKNNKIFDVDV